MNHDTQPAGGSDSAESNFLRKGRTIGCWHCMPTKYADPKIGMYCDCTCHDASAGKEHGQCEWENCSGGQYCEKHSLMNKPASAEETMDWRDKWLADDMDASSANRQREWIANLLLQEQKALVEAILEKKGKQWTPKDYDGKPYEIVSVENILKVAASLGITKD